jgi:hypothetical protein
MKTQVEKCTQFMKKLQSSKKNQWVAGVHTV